MNSNEIGSSTKYGMDLPPDPNHPILGAMQVAGRTRALVARETGDTAWLFDPARSPQMWWLAKRTMCNMRQPLHRIRVLPPEPSMPRLSKAITCR